MTNIEAMKLALDALEYKHPKEIIYDLFKKKTIAALRQAISEAEQRCKGCDELCSPDCLDKSGVCASCGWPIWPSEKFNQKEPVCNPHPDAPHGFDRNASHNEGRYVCECEGWEPEQTEQEPVK